MTLLIAKEYNSQEDDYFWSQRGDRSMRGGCPPGGVIGPPVDIVINHIVLSSLKFIMWLWVILGGRAGCQEVFVKFLSLLKCVWSSSKSKFFVPNFEPGPEVNFECVHTLPVLDWSHACRSRDLSGYPVPWNPVLLYLVLSPDSKCSFILFSLIKSAKPDSPAQKSITHRRMIILVSKRR